MGKCLGIIHVWHVRIPFSKFPSNGKCDSTTRYCINLRAAFSRKLRMVVENFCSWCKRWPILCYFRGLLLGVPYGYRSDWLRHDISGVSIHVRDSILSYGRVNCMSSRIPVLREYLRRNQV